MHWLRRHGTLILVIAMAAATWSALFIVYDYRSPVNQMLRGVGTVPLEGWQAHELDDVCVRLEGPFQIPPIPADKAVATAAKKYPDAYVREVILVSYRDTCSGSGPRLAWAISLGWTASADDAAPARKPVPRAVAIVDAVSGQLIMSNAQGVP